MTQHLRIGGVRIDPYRGGFTASAKARDGRAVSLAFVADELPAVIYDRIVMAEVEGRHAVDALMRVADESREAV